MSSDITNLILESIFFRLLIGHRYYNGLLFENNIVFNFDWDESLNFFDGKHVRRRDKFSDIVRGYSS